MGVEIVQDDMNLAAGVLGYDAVHEVKELGAAAALVMITLHQPRGHLQSRKQRGRAVPLVIVLKAGEGLAVGQLQPALGPFQSLNVRFFIHAQHQRCPVG